jgi:Zn finger protein HypA/HybF involved in hydrogenase expression
MYLFFQITHEKARKIESSTRNQSQSSEWFKERKYRLTASKFGEIVKMTDKRNRQKLCASLLNTTFCSKAMLHGRQYESKALNVFEKKFNLKCKKCGLFVRPDLPYLGASPDGVIDNETLVEVKCPYAGREALIAPGKLFPFLMMKKEILC